MAATIYSVRISIDSILVKDDCDWLGDGELYFIGKVGTYLTGRSRIFKAGDNSLVDLTSLKWV